MDRIRAVAAMHDHADRVRARGETLGLVPTMGALHDGHLALVREALDRCDHVVVSIFVNPTQFAPDEDYDDYPRDLEGDEAKLREMGVDAVFAPTVEEMYPNAGDADLPGPLTWVTVDRLTDHLCGAYRDGHFRGVTTVVAKLLNACKPHVAVFGTKDAQQLVVLRRMVEDLLMDVDVVGVETVREPDGLASSSRNKYLGDEEREQSTALHAAVTSARRRVQAGEQDAKAVVEAMREALSAAPRGDVQYAEVVDAHTLQPIDRIEPGQDVLAAVAVFFGDTRLIDNAFISAPAVE
jgi:pantoate--beta-alanine ligase